MTETLRPRFVFVSTQMEAAGVQVLAVNLLKALNDEGIATELVFLYKKREVFSDVEGVTWILPRPPTGLLDIASAVFGLMLFMLRKRPIGVVGWAHYSSPLAAIAAWLSGAKFRVATHVSYERDGHLKSFADLLDLFCGYTGIYTSNVAASHAIRGRFKRHPERYRRTLKTVYNGILWKASDLTKAQARAAFDLPSDQPLIVSCGRLSRQKNHAFLLDVMVLMPDVHLAILGEGELRQDLECQIAKLGLGNRVTLVGEVQPQRVPDFLSAGDVFAFPSLWEGFGLAVVEAMLAGLPVVSSNHPVLKEVVADSGVLLPVNNARAWADALTRLLKDPALSSQATVLGKKRAEQFNFGAMLEGFKREMRA